MVVAMRAIPVLVVVILACGCSSGGSAPPRAALASVASWCCWLQAPDVDTLAASGYELVVMDYSFDGSASREFDAADVQRLHDAGKRALAYFSIGEAESYRFYWQASWQPGNPAFLAEANPSWPGNYAVEYWTEEWWNAAIRPYLDRILAQGFDGVYLDRVDAYLWWYLQRDHDLRTAADRMVRLIERIAAYARTRAGNDFVVCPQNGLALVVDAGGSDQRRFLAAIDGVGVESLFFNYATPADQQYRLALLAEIDAAGKKILLLEYVAEADWPEFVDRIATSGLDMIGYAAAPDAALDELIVGP